MSTEIFKSHVSNEPLGNTMKRSLWASGNTMLDEQLGTDYSPDPGACSPRGSKNKWRVKLQQVQLYVSDSPETNKVGEVETKRMII